MIKLLSVSPVEVTFMPIDIYHRGTVHHVAKKKIEVRVSGQKFKLKYVVKVLREKETVK